MKRKVIAVFICFLLPVVILAVSYFRARPLKEEMGFSVENIASFEIVTHEVYPDYDCIRKAEITEKEEIAAFFEKIGKTEVRKFGPRTGSISYTGSQKLYRLSVNFTDRESNVFDTSSFLTTGRIDMGKSVYMIIGENKTWITDLLEELLQEYEIKE